MASKMKPNKDNIDKYIEDTKGWYDDSMPTCPDCGAKMLLVIGTKVKRYECNTCGYVGTSQQI